MGVFKEHANSFEKVARMRSRIFTDAADYGVAYNSKNIPQEIADLIYFVKDLKGTSLMKKRRKYHNGVEIIIEIGWEIDEGFECGTRYIINASKISKVHSKINKDATHMISVDVENYRTKR